jgi:hypothetical protein
MRKTRSPRTSGMTKPAGGEADDHSHAQPKAGGQPGQEPRTPDVHVSEVTCSQFFLGRIGGGLWTTRSGASTR